MAPEFADADPPVRQLLCRNASHVYRIIFRIDGNTVTVLHVRHCARDYLEEPE